MQFNNPASTKNMTTLHSRKSIDRSPLRRGLLLVALALGCFALPPIARAVLPAPDGGYPNFNTAEGQNALFSLTGGSYNTASGAYALYSNTTGHYNTATGSDALPFNTTGSNNTANGFEALFSNTTGSNNTASGGEALNSNTTGSYNTANGISALFSNTTGSQNAATGSQALYSNKTGFSNTASGFSALYFNTSGVGNAADGTFALYHNTTGGNNTAMGNYTLLSNTVGNYNTAVGSAALEYSTGANNIALGNQAGFNLTTGNNNIDIGALGVAGESGKIRMGKSGTHNATFIAGIYGKTVASGTKVGLMIDSTGKLGTVVSSARFKEAIRPMDKVSEAILSLQPVTFRYKQELDPDGIPQFGLVAEQVEKVNPDLVVRGEDGKVTTVRYEAVNAMLLNEFLKEHRKVEEQGAIIAQQQKQIEALTTGLKEQVSKIQKVSDQLELTKSAPQLVANP